jgi:hypothetical protein
MLLIPDPNTAFMDPFRDTPTLVLICNVVDPLSKKPYPRDPRQYRAQSRGHLLSAGVADQAFFGAEAEFFIFDSIRFDQLHSTASTTSTPTKAAGTGRVGAQPRLSSALQGRLLPRPAHGPLPGPAHRNGRCRCTACGTGRRVSSPRSGHRRAVPKSTCASTPLVKSADNMMKYKWIMSRAWPISTARRPPSCPSPSLATTAPACTPTSRLGRRASRSLPAISMPAFRKWRCGMPAACSSTARPGGLHRAHHQLLQAPGSRL